MIEEKYELYPCLTEEYLKKVLKKEVFAQSLKEVMIGKTYLKLWKRELINILSSMTKD